MCMCDNTYIYDTIFTRETFIKSFNKVASMRAIGIFICRLGEMKTLVMQ